MLTTQQEKLNYLARNTAPPLTRTPKSVRKDFFSTLTESTVTTVTLSTDRFVSHGKVTFTPHMSSGGYLATLTWQDDAEETFLVPFGNVEGGVSDYLRRAHPDSEFSVDTDLAGGSTYESKLTEGIVS